MNTDTIRAIFLYWMSLALSMAAVVQLETKVDLSNHQSLVMTTAILLPALSVLFGLRVWRRWKVVIVKEVNPREVINLVGEPFLDPVRGVLMNGISTSGGTFEVLIEPKWWHLFPRSAISKDGEKECAIFNAGYSSVLPGTEPTSLVMLKAKDLAVGFGARVRFNGCSDYLLTAYHVIKPHEKLNLCKGGYMVEDVDLAVTCGSDHDAVDFALIKVPPAVWSKLKVGVGKLEPMTKKTHITVYGGSDSTRLLSSSGPAYKGKAGYAIIHEASTTKGWSGTPLYSGNTIVGVHTGSGQVGYSNRAVNVKLLLTAVSKFETIFSEISYGELDEDNYLLRNRDDFVEVEILGKGKFLLGDSSFVDITGKPLGWEKEKRARGEALWHDASDDDFYEDANFLADFYKDSKETVDDIMLEHLNCQRVATTSKIVSPPSLSLRPMSGRTSLRVSPHEGCPLPTLDDRVASLEKLLERSLEQLLQLQVSSSQNSKDIAGLIEVQKQSVALSSIKREGSNQPPRQQNSTKQSSSLPQSTQKQSPEPASGESSGIKKKSRRKRGKSDKRKSTPKPPPASHSPSWVKQTKKC
nr:ORF2a [Subterranean clover mottle virus]